MHVEAKNGMVTLKKLGRNFTARDAERMAEMLETLAPFSQLILDFTAVRGCDAVAFQKLVSGIQRLAGVAVVLRGLTRHEARLLRYLGLRATEVCAQA